METVNLSTQKLEVPTTIKEATTCPDKSEWTATMEAEMKSLFDNKVWDLVELPKERKAVGIKRVYKKKSGANGQVEDNKARLVARDFSQKYGANYDKSFCQIRVTLCFNSIISSTWL